MKTFAFILALISSTAIAQTPIRTEILHQADAGVSEITGGLLHTTSKAKFEGNLRDGDAKLTLLGVKYEYGFSENVSFGAALLYPVSSSSVGPSADFKFTGISDLNLFSRTQHGLSDKWTINTLAELNISLGRGKFDLDNNLKTTGRSLQTGGIELGLGVGLTYQMNKEVKTGARLTTELGIQDKKVNVNVPGLSVGYEGSGGYYSKLGFFVESDTTIGTLGGEVYYSGLTTTNYKANGYINLSTGGGNDIGATAYGVFSVKEDLKMLASLSYEKGVALDSGVSSANAISANLTGRFSF